MMLKKKKKQKIPSFGQPSSLIGRGCCAMTLDE